jgi:hypothetical protein
MANHIPSIAGMAIGVPLQLLLLAALGFGFYGDLCRDCRKRPAAVALLTGMMGGIVFRLVILLVTDDGTYGALCRSFCSSNLPDSFWIFADFIEQGLLGFGGLGLILAWLVVRYGVRGIRPDKTTTLIAGVLAGLVVGAIVEYSQVRWGNARAMNSARLVFFSLLGGFLFLVSRPFLFRKGRFQFGIKNLLAYTVVWALVFGWLGPQWTRYQSESEAMASLATSLGGPVECQRIEGLVGLAYVHYIDFPPCTITDAQVDTVIAELERLPRLAFVYTGSASISKQGLKRLEDALPHVHIGGISSSDNEREEILPDTNRFGQPPGPQHRAGHNSAPR